MLYKKAVDPTVNDDSSLNFEIGNEIVNTVTGKLFECFDATVGAAIWREKGSLFLGGPSVIGDDAILDTPAFSVDQDDYDPVGWRIGGIIDKSFLIVNPSANVDLTGIVPSSPELRNDFILFNNGTGTLTLVNGSALSLANNRFSLKNNITVQQQEAIRIIRAVNINRFIAINV